MSGGPDAFPSALHRADNATLDSFPDQDRLAVWLGPHFFHGAMGHFRWRVIHHPCQPGTVLSWDEILSLTNGQIPDAVVAAEFSGPPFLLGMENFPCLTVFYSVDTHIHSWHPAYAQGFDLCLVSLPEHVRDFYTGRLRPEQIIWSPPYTLDEARPPDPLPEKKWDLLFHGTVNPELNPARCSFLAEVKKHFPDLRIIATGGFAAFFPKARLVLNECTRGELNFRVFEALGCGACLLTPDIGPALTDLFTDGKELVLYPAYDAQALVARAEALLRDDARRTAIAAAGLAAVDARHRASHRALALASRLHALIASGEGAAMIAARQRMAGEIFRNVLRPLYLHHAESIDIESLRTAYLKAATAKFLGGALPLQTSPQGG